MMLPSGNDAAQVIAENLGAYLYFESLHQLYKIRTSGDFFLNEEINQPPKEYSQYFISEMNKFARKLDLKNTLYANPHGLDHMMNKSTAQDVCQLGSKYLYYQLNKQHKLHCLMKLFKKFVNVNPTLVLQDQKTEMLSNFNGLLLINFCMKKGLFLVFLLVKKF